MSIVETPIQAGEQTPSRPYFELANLEIPRILATLPKGLTALDVGCGSGVHGAELKRVHGYHVTGVDLSESSIEKAKRRLDRAYVGDVTRPDTYPFDGEQFDLLVYSDVLEHLPDAPGVVRRHLKFLKPGGSVLISLPNVAIWNVRLGLLFGNFDYTDTGTLDRTHVRFYTLRTVQEFLTEAGLKLEHRRVTPGLARPFAPLIKRFYVGSTGAEAHGDTSLVLESPTYQRYTRWIYPVERWITCLWPGMFAFQIVSLCRRA